MNDVSSSAIIYNSHITDYIDEQAKLVIEVRRDRTIIKPTRLATTNIEPRRGGGKRGQTTQYTKESQARFIQSARELAEIKHWIVLTYPGDCFPTDNAEITKHWDKVRGWLRRRNISGIAIREYQSRGAVHHNLLVDNAVDIGKLRRYWSKVVSATNPDDDIHSVWMTSLDTQLEIDKIINYLAKFAQKTVPENMHGNRFWRILGTPKRHPVLIFEGTNAELAEATQKLITAEQEYCTDNGLRVHEYNQRYRSTLYHVQDMVVEIVEQTKQKSGN